MSLPLVWLAYLIGWRLLASSGLLAALAADPPIGVTIESQSDHPVHDSVSVQLDEANQRWLQHYHQFKGDVSPFYLPNAVLFPEQEIAIRGNTSIGAYYRRQY